VTTHTISIDPAAPGRFDAYVSDRLLVANTLTPFFASARALLAEGLAKPKDTVVMVHRANPFAECLRAKVSKAAKLTRRARPVQNARQFATHCARTRPLSP
jgi:hypothetical protein